MTNHTGPHQPLPVDKLAEVEATRRIVDEHREEQGEVLFDGEEMLGHIVEYFQEEYGRRLEYLTVVEVGPDLAGRDLTEDEMRWIHEQVVNGEPKRDDVVDFFRGFYFSNDGVYMCVVDEKDNFICFVDAGDRVDEILEKLMARGSDE